ncbi:MAG: hypothetical protein HZA06_05385 [Nitrospirae bacterium]|nr:hypothetical protein [Nitrospirota bacterium]
MRSAVHIIFAAAMLFVVYVEGLINPFTAWNILPIAFVWIIFYYAVIRPGISRSKPARQLRIYGLVLFTAVAVIIAHLAWLLDWGGTATGSSTSGLMFVTLPFLALSAGCIGWLAGWCIGFILSRCAG